MGKKSGDVKGKGGKKDGKVEKEKKERVKKPEKKKKWWVKDEDEDKSDGKKASKSPSAKKTQEKKGAKTDEKKPEKKPEKIYVTIEDFDYAKKSGKMLDSPRSLRAVKEVMNLIDPADLRVKSAISTRAEFVAHIKEQNAKTGPGGTKIDLGYNNKLAVDFLFEKHLKDWSEKSILAQIKKVKKVLFPLQI